MIGPQLRWPEPPSMQVSRPPPQRGFATLLITLIHTYLLYDTATIRYYRLTAPFFLYLFVFCVLCSRPFPVRGPALYRLISLSE